MSATMLKAVSILATVLGIVALLAFMLAGLSTAQTGRGYGEVAVWLVVMAVLWALAYQTRRMSR